MEDSVQIKLTSKEVEEVNRCLNYFNVRKEENLSHRLYKKNKIRKNTEMDKTKKNASSKIKENCKGDESPKLDKSREDIMAEREKKKQMKLAAKQKKKDGKPDVPEIGEIKSIESTSIEVPLITQNDGKGDVVKLEDKTREDIMAEREKKKLAKQASKNKNKNEKQDLDKKSSDAQKSSDNQKSELDRKLSTDSTQKSKAELRAERREKQEAQRAAKESVKKPAQVEKPIETAKKPPTVKPVDITVIQSVKKNAIPGQQRVKLFSHLHFDLPSLPSLIINTIHPSILKLGSKYSARVVSGSNARCVALLNALQDLITDFVTPVEKEFSRALETCLVDSMSYLNKCRPTSVSMTNALKHIKSHLTQLHNVSEREAKKKLNDVIDIFIKEQIDVAGDAICIAVQKKITNGDVILIFACSSLLYRIIEESHREGKKFTVVVVDGGPWYEGREMLRRLVALGIKCTYVLVSALSFIIGQTTKVLLGAHALLANGYVMSRAGSSLVALMAKAHNVPVLVCCETYKFCERVQTDVFVYNELGNPMDFVETDHRLKSWESNPYLTPLSLLYDITPPDLITAVVTEIAILPCTSVPVILRIKPSDMVV